MTDPEWEIEVHLSVAPGFSIYDDGQDHPVAIFYHAPHDEMGIVLEAKARREMVGYLDEAGVISRLRDGGDAAKEKGCVVPVTNTAGVVGVLKGEIEFIPVYKHWGDVTREEASTIVEFMQNWAALFDEEEARMDEHEEYLRRRAEGEE